MLNILKINKNYGIIYKKKVGDTDGKGRSFSKAGHYFQEDFYGKQGYASGIFSGYSGDSEREYSEDHSYKSGASAGNKRWKVQPSRLESEGGR